MKVGYLTDLFRVVAIDSLWSDFSDSFRFFFQAAMHWCSFCEVRILLVQFHPLNDWVVGRTWGKFQHRFFSSFFCRRPLWAALAWAGMSILWCCPSCISSADYSIAHPRRCPGEWFWRGCRGMWHARTMQVSVSWQLPKELLVDILLDTRLNDDCWKLCFLKEINEQGFVFKWVAM